MCQEFDRLHRTVVAERDDVKRAENTNRMIELVANTWVAVPILEGMGYWAVNPKHVGAFKPVPGRHEFGDVSGRKAADQSTCWVRTCSDATCWHACVTAPE